ncbi:MAG: dTDP-4-dehydrorhamnose 3,5-epimerase [Bacteroidetes bacterium]|nr:dTDP-4-dehydrorhamnose 3,5-epimerase [Bacteroidota bacterium]
MKIIATPISDLWIIEPSVFGDDRGYFLETFHEKRLAEAGINTHFVQDNESKSKRGVVRGLHYQLAPNAQAKLVRVVSGEVLDVAVDLRRNSPTFGKHFSVVLSGKNKKQFYVPRGFAHGFSVLSEEAVFVYKCDNFYDKASEAGIVFNDPQLAIDWHLPENECLVSEKDRLLPTFSQANYNF